MPTFLSTFWIWDFNLSRSTSTYYIAVLTLLCKYNFWVLFPPLRIRQAQEWNNRPLCDIAHPPQYFSCPYNTFQSLQSLQTLMSPKRERHVQQGTSQVIYTHLWIQVAKLEMIGLCVLIFLPGLLNSTHIYFSLIERCYLSSAHWHFLQVLSINCVAYRTQFYFPTGYTPTPSCCISLAR